MSATSHGTRAAAAATLLVLAGVAIGIVIGRGLPAPAPVVASALTIESLAERIDLSSEEQDRLRTLLDSLHEGVVAAASEGPEALQAATEAAHRRIEASLAPEARAEFRLWLQESRDHMMARIHADMMGGAQPHEHP
jgi:hypothetical protein